MNGVAIWFLLGLTCGVGLSIVVMRVPLWVDSWRVAQARARYFDGKYVIEWDPYPPGIGRSMVRTQLLPSIEETLDMHLLHEAGHIEDPLEEVNT